MIKIAIFQKDLGLGGIEKSLINLLNELDYSKYEVDLYLFSNNDFYKNKLPKKLNIIYLKQLPYFTRFISFSILKKIKKYKIEKEYDFAIDYNSYDQACAIACINTSAKEHIMWVHNDVEKEYKNDIKYKILRFFFKSKYKHFTKFVCVSNGLIKPFKKLNHIKHNNFLVIPNIVLANEIIEKSKEKVDLKVDKNKYNLVSVGRLVIQKGFDILLDDMKEITTKRQDIHLYIIGDGKLRKKLEKKTQKYNLEKYVTFLGSKPNPFKYEALMDGFILESRYEGQGIAFLEAKVLGLDLIIPDHLKEYITDVPYTNDVCSTVSSLQKKNEKTFDYLENYNKEIIKKINELFKSH